MYKTSVSQLNEYDANDYIICYNCKNLTHLMRKSVYGDLNHCSISGLGTSSSTVVGECVECYDARTQEELRKVGRKRIIFMKRYLEEEGDPRQITMKDDDVMKQLRKALGV